MLNGKAGAVENGVCSPWADKDVANAPLRANIDETVLPVVITEQGEKRNQR
jgi:hypothetical protein